MDSQKIAEIFKLNKFYSPTDKLITDAIFYMIFVSFASLLIQHSVFNLLVCDIFHFACDSRGIEVSNITNEAIFICFILDPYSQVIPSSRDQ